MHERRQQLRAQLTVMVRPDVPIVWEIGCGHGHFLTAYARSHPAAVCVGIDTSGERIERAIRKRERARLANLHFPQAEAQMFPEVQPVGGCFSSVFVLFPDPWPKKRHHKHRLMQPPFLHSLALRAARDGRLFFRTDHLPYFQHTAGLFIAHPDLQIAPPDTPWPFEHETVFQSRARGHHSLIASVRRP